MKGTPFESLKLDHGASVKHPRSSMAKLESFIAFFRFDRENITRLDLSVPSLNLAGHQGTETPVYIAVIVGISENGRHALCVGSY